jgi:hypothetical protein
MLLSLSPRDTDDEETTRDSGKYIEAETKRDGQIQQEDREGESETKLTSHKHPTPWLMDL